MSSSHCELWVTSFSLRFTHQDHDHDQALGWVEVVVFDHM